MRRPLHDTTRLPKKLREQLGIKDDFSRNGTAPKRGPAGRRERRKADRLEKKKQQVNQHQSKPLPQPMERVESLPKRDARRFNVENGFVQKPKSILKKLSPPQASSSPSPPPPRKSRTPKEDSEIAALEKKLGLKGSKKLPKSFAEDGLDELLEGLNSDGSGSELRKRRREGDDWLQSKRQKTQAVGMDVEEDDEDNDSEEEEENLEDDGLEVSGLSDEFEEDESASSEGDFEGFDPGEAEEQDEEEHSPAKKRENPYIAPVTATTTSSQPKYIPPSLRKAADSDTEALLRLKRHTQGLLNRLSEASLLSILGDIEKLYQNHARQNVTSTILELLLDRFNDSPGALQDTFVILHAGFIAAIYRIIGTDFGAALLERLVETVDRLYKRAEHETVGKQTANLIALASQLYNLQVIGTSLIFDYVRLFLRNLTEYDTELLLKVIKNSGSQLRRDDPSSLKDIVVMIQPVAAKQDANLSVRTKFMIETITDLKNNRMKTGVGASDLMAEHLTKMRKILGSLSSRNVRATEPLNIGLDDVRNSDKRGKWWLVGASWKKEPTSDTTTVPIPDIVNDTEASSDDEGSQNEVDLRALAKAHGMNTDIRRAIFITLMTSANAEDAHLRLLKLRLKKAQELEIPRVVTHCVGAEGAYNPYYGLVANKVCTVGGRRLRMAFQFALWDVLKRLGERFDAGEDNVQYEAMEDESEGEGLGATKLFNLARFFGHLVTNGILTLNALKLLTLTHLQPKTRTFVELLIVTVILKSQRGEQGKDENAIADVFIQVKQTLHMIKGLQWFLKKRVSRTDLAGGAKKKATVKWACKVAFDTLSVAEKAAAIG